MSDQPNNPDPKNDERGKEPSRPLSEISHLFLSSIRDRQTNGAARPVRKPPTNATTNAHTPTKSEPTHTIDLTPEEFAQVYGGSESSHHDESRPDVTAVIAAHLNGRQIDRVREYAAHLSSTHGRVGLIELDASEFRLMLFERRQEGASSEVAEAAFNAPEKLDPKRMTEALEELNWDVDRWLVLLPTPRTPDARELLRSIDRWTLLATCDHDGMVSAYRTLKGLADLRNSESEHSEVRPKLSLALLDVRSHDEADRVMLKLAGVCEQFLNWPLESEALVKPASQVSDHLVLCCRAGKETAGAAAGPQFKVVHDFLARSEKPAEKKADKLAEQPMHLETQTRSMPEPPTAFGATAPQAASISALPQTPGSSPELRIASAEPSNAAADVIDLPGDDSNPAAVVSAFLRGSNHLAETPLKAPSCPGASLAVSRDRKLVLVAVARQGLCDLRDIAQAYRWMIENRPLIAMALPQFAIEPSQSPRLQLLIAQSDVSAEMLQPLLQSSNVTVQTYRKLRWGGKTGLLLEAA